jgi:hypothetical protein
MMTLMAWAEEISRWFLAVVLFGTGFLKLVGDPDSFSETLVLRPSPGVRMPRATPRLLGMTEVLVAGLLIGPAASERAGGPAAVLLLATATVVVMAAVIRGSTSSCGCSGGSVGRRVDRRSVGRAATLASLAVITTIGIFEGQREWTNGAQAVVDAGSAAAGLLYLCSLPDVRSERALRRSRATVSALSNDCASYSIGRLRLQLLLRHNAIWAETAHLRVTHSTRHSDTWTEGCWVFISVPAIHSGEPAILTFGIHQLAVGQPRAILTEARSGCVVLRVGQEQILAHPDIAPV